MEISIDGSHHHKGIPMNKSILLIPAVLVGVAFSSFAMAQTAASSSTTAVGTSYTCKDGTVVTAASSHGACKGHGGQQNTGKSKSPKTPKANPTTMPIAPAVTPVSSMKPAAVKPAAPSTATQPAQRPTSGGNGQVWVNAKSHVYHCANDRYYGKTKEGSFMSESQAVAQGNHGVDGKACH